MRLTRREWIAAGLKAGAGVCVSSCAARLLHAMPRGYVAGIQLYTVRKSLANDPAGTLKALAAIGYREVETAGTAHLQAADLHTLIAAAGLKCVSAHVEFTPQDFRAGFTEAKALGAWYATSSTLPNAVFPNFHANDPGSPLTATNFREIAEVMNKIGKAAQEEGLIYTYHNHNIEFVRLQSGEFGYDILLQETDKGTVFFEADCGWMAVGGADPAEYLSRHHGRFRMIHVKDFAPVAGPVTALTDDGGPKGVELGQGFIDYRKIFSAARAAGVEHVFVEQEGPFVHTELESAKADYHFLAALQ